MSNELATVEAQSLVPSVNRSGRIGAVSLDQIWTLAGRYAKCNMLPQGIKSAEQLYIALLAGYEAGLPLSVAAKSVMVVNNRPTIWGDGALGLVRASGLCEWIKEWVEGEGDERVAYCETKRVGEVEPVLRSFSVADAKKAQLWTKSGPWVQYPLRMLATKPRSFLLRDVYADVLMGLHVREEVEDYADAGGSAAGGSTAGESAQLVDALPVDDEPPVDATIVDAEAAATSATDAPAGDADPLDDLPGEPVPQAPAPDLTTPELFHDALEQLSIDRMSPSEFGALFKAIKLNHAITRAGVRQAVYAAFVAGKLDLTSGKIIG